LAQKKFIMRDQKSSSNLSENWLRWSSGQINFEFFGTLEVFFAKSEKNPISSWKIREFLDFFFKFTLLQRPFFSKKKVLWSCSKLAQMRFRVNKFKIFWNIRDFFLKSFSKSDFKFEIWPNFKIGIGFFFNFFKKSLKCSKINEIYLFWNSSEKILSKIRTQDFYKGFRYEKILHWNSL